MSLTTERPRIADSDWDQIEATIAAFEGAWINGDRPSVANYLVEADPLRTAILIELVHAEIEFRLKAGEPARVESYLAAYPELRTRPGVVVDLIRAEWAIRARREADLSVDHYLARFPGLVDPLTASPAGPRPNRSTELSPATLAPSTWLDTPLPRRLGKYELRQNVGGGGFGFVFRAWDTVSHRDVALKVPRLEVASSPVDVHHFLREARNAIHLRHANIVAIQEAGPIDGTVCLISEFIEGMTLADRLRVGPLDVAEAVALMIPVLEALSHAHRRGIIHRDLKPSNILLDREEVPHLTDFGLAKRATGDSTLSPSGASRVVIGTPSYMAPEQARGDSAGVDARSDVYTAGVVLYEMLTGSVPFRGRGRLLQVQIEEADPPPLRELNEEIPPDLETICLKALAKHPDARYRSAGAMADDLASFRAGRPIAAQPVVALVPPPSWTRHRRLLGRLAIGLAGVVVLAALASKWQSMTGQLDADSRAIERLVRTSVEAADLPFQGGASPADEHRRLTATIWNHSPIWFAALADRTDQAEFRVDLLIRAAEHSAALGADPATRAAWAEVVRAIDAVTRVQPLTANRRADLARALAALGELHAAAGDRDEAQRCSERAATAWNKVAKHHRDQLATIPDQPATRLDLAEAILAGDRAARNANQGGTAGAVAEAERIADELRLLTNLTPAEMARLGAIQLCLARRSQALDQPSLVAYWGNRALRSAGADPNHPGGPEDTVEAARAMLILALVPAESAARPGAGSRDDAPGGAGARLQAAIATFTRASRLDPTDLELQRDLAAAQAGLATLLARQGQHDPAVRWFGLALQLHKTLRQARPEAHADLAAAAAVHAGLARTHWHRGRTWAMLRQSLAAVIRAHQALRLAPGVDSYRQARNQYALNLLQPHDSHCLECRANAQTPLFLPEHREIELP